MENITFKRILRWFLASLIVMISIAFIFHIGIASAESGDITITDTKTNIYTGTSYANGGAVGQPNFTKIYWDTVNFNNILAFNVGKITSTDIFIFPKSFDSTVFTISSGGSGGGIVYYDNNFSKVYYLFDTGNVYTSSPLTINLTSNIFINVQYYEGAPPYYNCGDNALSSSNGIWLGSVCTGWPYLTRMNYITNIETRTTDNYIVNYPISNYFNLTLTKNGGLGKKYFILNDTNIISQETTFNSNSFSFTGFYTTGLYLNGTMSSGAYYLALINSSGSSIGGGDLTPVILNGVGITFGRSTYTQHDVANISWIRTSGTPFLCTDYVRLQTPNEKYDLVSSPANSGYTKELLSLVGTYETTFERSCLFSGTSILASHNASVGLNEQNSYVYAPAQVGVGQNFNVTYLTGFTKTSGSTVWLRDFSWDSNTNSWSTTYQPWATSGTKGVETNQSIIVTKTGKHLIKLCDVLLGCKTSTQTEAFFNGSVVTTNISLSNITIDKTTYSYGETILVKTAVDNTNWTNKQTVVEYENYGMSIVQNQQYIQKQVESFPLYVSDLTFSGSGSSRLRLTGRNSTGSYVLAFVNFTLSSVDTEGYGLSIVGDNNCVGNTIQINVIVPSGEKGNLSISADNIKYNKVFVINGTTKTISYKYQITGTYYITLSVNGEAKRVIIKSVSNTGNCDIPTPTPTYKGINGTWTATNENIKNTCSYWDTWVRVLFSSQGVNNITRLLFALFSVVIVMFTGMLLSKGNFGVAVILGFFPYAFFSYLTLSTPCGQYIPIWVNIFIALIIGIKMRWFS